MNLVNELNICPNDHGRYIGLTDIIPIVDCYYIENTMWGVVTS